MLNCEKEFLLAVHSSPDGIEMEDNDPRYQIALSLFRHEFLRCTMRYDFATMETDSDGKDYPTRDTRRFYTFTMEPKGLEAVEELNRIADQKADEKAEKHKHMLWDLLLILISVLVTLFVEHFCDICRWLTDLFT